MRAWSARTWLVSCGGGGGAAGGAGVGGHRAGHDAPSMAAAAARRGSVPVGGWLVSGSSKWQPQEGEEGG